MRSEDRTDLSAALRTLDARINDLLPPRYLHCYQSIPPKSMGSAKLKIGADGRVAWGEIWTSFCDLALAGGPPHRGTFLQEVSPRESDVESTQYQTVIRELARAIQLTTGLESVGHFEPGWIAVDCRSDDASRWLQFAVVAENVMARRNGPLLLLPAGSHFFIEKQIKNITVALAKSFHYWDGHLTVVQQQAFRDDEIVEPATKSEIDANPQRYREGIEKLAAEIQSQVDWTVFSGHYPGWLGVDCPTEEVAAWFLRALAVEQILVRRENTCLFLPIDAECPANITRVGHTFHKTMKLWKFATDR
jgi:sirohydrochlorin cobaltochelatase